MERIRIAIRCLAAAVGGGKDRAAHRVVGSLTLAAVADGVESEAPAERVLSGLLQPWEPDCAEACRFRLVSLDRELAQGGTGLAAAVGLWLSGTRALGAAVGDSGAWLFSAVRPPRCLTRAAGKPLLGSGEALPSEFEVGLSPGDTLLLASAGLLRYANPRRLEEAVVDPDLERVAETLVERARLPLSGELADDLSLILLRLGR